MTQSLSSIYPLYLLFLLCLKFIYKWQKIIVNIMNHKEQKDVRTVFLYDKGKA